MIVLYNKKNYVIFFIIFSILIFPTFIFASNNIYTTKTNKYKDGSYEILSLYKNGEIQRITKYGINGYKIFIKSYNQKNTLIYQSSYSSNKVISRSHYYNDGKLKEKSIFKWEKDNIYYKKTKRFYENNLLKAVNFRSNSYFYNLKYFNTGIKQEVTIYSNNYQDGIFIKFNKNGSTNWKQSYKNGLPSTLGSKFDENGIFLKNQPVYNFNPQREYTISLPDGMSYITFHDTTLKINDLKSFGIKYTNNELKIIGKTEDNFNENIIKDDSAYIIIKSNFNKFINEQYKTFLRYKDSTRIDDKKSIKYIGELTYFIPDNFLLDANKNIKTNLHKYLNIKEFTFNKYIIRKIGIKYHFNSNKNDHWSSKYTYSRSLLESFYNNKKTDTIDYKFYNAFKIYTFKNKKYIIAPYSGYENSGKTIFTIKNGKFIKLISFGSGV